MRYILDFWARPDTLWCLSCSNVYLSWYRSILYTLCNCRCTLL